VVFTEVFTRSGKGATVCSAIFSFDNPSVAPKDSPADHANDGTDDEKAVAILNVARGAIAPHGRLVLLETMLRPTASTIYPVLSDLNMLLVTGGCERTEAEYRALYRAAGFELTKTVLTKSPTGTTVIEGRPT
jgi:O-methyltransferase domain